MTQRNLKGNSDIEEEIYHIDQILDTLHVLAAEHEDGTLKDYSTFFIEAEHLLAHAGSMMEVADGIEEDELNKT